MALHEGLADAGTGGGWYASLLGLWLHGASLLPFPFQKNFLLPVEQMIEENYVSEKLVHVAISTILFSFYSSYSWNGDENEMLYCEKIAPIFNDAFSFFFFFLAFEYKYEN